MALLSVMGLYNYRPDLFDGITVPDGMKKAVLEMHILIETAELEVLYSDPDFLKLAITNWAEINLANWQKMWAAFNLEYNPIWNKDGTITETEERNLARSDERERNDNGTNRETTEGETGGTDTTKETGFNSSDFVNSSQVITDGTTSETTTGTTTGNMKETGSGKDEETRTYTRRETGNIGVTTTQQMLKEEYEIAEINIYDKIANDFKKHFCILVY